MNAVERNIVFLTKRLDEYKEAIIAARARIHELETELTAYKAEALAARDVINVYTNLSRPASFLMPVEIAYIAARVKDE